MHNRRCSEAQPTDKQPITQPSPARARLWLFGLIISPHAGLLFVVSVGFRRLRFATPTVMHNLVPSGTKES
ncbi:MAG: hypothetical protein LBP87_15860 [Planctomycetaceae bacterium]|nr:hypothetical protein [Planctomycetaceae bacterium]